VIDRSKTRDTPFPAVALVGRVPVWNTRRGTHLGQRSYGSATTGRTYARKRSDQITARHLARREPSTYAGTYCAHIRNQAAARSWSYNIVVSAGNANTDQQYVIPIPGDVAGVWPTDTSARGLDFRITLAAGSTWNGGTHNTWTAGAFLSTAA